MSLQRTAPKTGIKLVITLMAGLMVQAAQALPVIDFGVAQGYSGFFFGDVKAQNDVEGRLAVGGNFTGNGSIGYRTPHGSTGPSLVVGGNAHFNANGGIFNGPKTPVDTNATVGPITEYEKAPGYGVYGGTLSGQTQGMDLRQQAGVIDFAQAKNQLGALAGQLGQQAATGTVAAPWSDTTLTGSGRSGVVEVFDLNAKLNWEGKQSIGTLELGNVAADSWVVINVRNAGDVSFTGAFLGLFDDLRGRVLFNFENASNIAVNTFIEGSILAPNANFLGQGHVEGTVIGQSVSQAFEIGHEPFIPTSPVPEPESYALMLAGLAAMGFIARRRRHA
ncbi:choice-of-anchor A family protein [Paucibacter sp. O1-1]|nr:choice-of-anchor A family protein [Paucibacter sp. O1-1]MDA3828281.1 choice-of-anchor A family protein [Paucibacter sp. O1-1]